MAIPIAKFEDEEFIQSIIDRVQNLSLLSERLEKAATLKSRGTEQFNSGDYRDAAVDYKRAASLAYTDPLKGDHADMFVKCWLNAGLCYVNEKSWHEVLHCCDKILDRHEESETNIKLLYRRGLAQMHIDNLDEAKADLMAAYKIDSKNTDVCKAIKELRAKISDAKKKEKAQFGGAFGKISMYDEKSVNYVLVPNAKGDELINFPDTILAGVAEFLTKTERALAAVAMTASGALWRKRNWKIVPANSSKVMVAAKPLDEIKPIMSSPEWLDQLARQKSYDWDFIDFEDIAKDLAERLTDSDIGGLLACIDAVNTVMTLKLRGCTSITGHGLEPLRGSLVLKKLDLSLAGSTITANERAHLVPAPSICVDAVIPILYSIVDDERSTLEHLQFPKTWRVVQDELLDEFLSKYNQMLDNRQLTCCHNHRHDEPPCGAICHGSEEYPWFSQIDDEDYGIQLLTCYECNGHFCQDHLEDMLPFMCHICDKSSCTACHLTTSCDSCGTISCHKCTRIEFCSSCEQELCGDCSENFWCEQCDEGKCEDCCPFLFCDNECCDKANCMECGMDDDLPEWVVSFCDICSSNFCLKHLVLSIAGSKCDDISCYACYTKGVAEMQRVNGKILDILHQAEKSQRYQEKLQGYLECCDLKMEDNIRKLWKEQERMKQRWIGLCDKATEDQKKNQEWIHIMDTMDNLFIA